MGRRICVIGLGYIGLPTTILLASKGIKVLGVDVDSDKLAKLAEGSLSVDEPLVLDLLRSCLAAGTLEFSRRVEKADVYVICVPTPLNKVSAGYPQADLTFVEEVVDEISEVIEAGQLVLLESTCPVGTSRRLFSRLSDQINGGEIRFAYCPERVLPGRIIEELTQNDRVVGGVDEKSTEQAVSFYKMFVEGQVLATTSETAEMCKLVENSFRDVNIAFANEISMIGDSYHVNVNELIDLANRHPRVNILRPGPGVGGHCIAVDPWFLVSDKPDDISIVRCARLQNKEKTRWVRSKIISQIQNLKISSESNVTIGIFGLTYKPDASDLRESASMEIYEELKSLEYTLILSDPCVLDSELPLVEPYEALQRVDVAIFLTAHSVFRSKEMRLKIKRLQIKVLDFCGCFES